MQEYFGLIFCSLQASGSVEIEEISKKYEVLENAREKRSASPKLSHKTVFILFF